MARNYSLLAILALLAIIETAMCTTIPDVKEFFDKSIKGNLTKITWAHAVNSQAKLEESLGNANIMMLEADVVLGTLNGTGSNSTERIPIMCHPPANESDLSLEEFLDKVLTDGKRGIKLDFKSIEAFTGSRQTLEKYRANMTVPVWLNADILVGPVDAEKGDAKPVNSEQFLSQASAVLPECTLSIGWTTRYGSKYNITKGSYTQDQIEKMASAIYTGQIKQTITFPVRAGLAANAAQVLTTLIKNTTANNPTLTIWSSEGDVVDVTSLSKLIKDVGVDKVYVDVPEDLWAKLDIKSAAPSLTISSVTFFASVLVSFAIAKLV